jgi:uncharacterized membrane-anchored protein
MKMSMLRRSRAQSPSDLTGTARLDRRTRAAIKRINPGDIAIIDHIDIDRAAAVSLVEAGVAGVVNLAPSISGRYPNLGPAILVDAGVVLIDNADHDAFTAISEGDQIRLEGDSIYKGDLLISTGVRQTRESVDEALARSRDGLASQLEAFSANGVEYLRREQALLLDGDGVPAVATKIDGQQVLVVTKAFDYAQELKALKTFIRENHPVLIGVDGGADALLDAGFTPHLVVGDLEDVSDRALRCGAEIVAHATSDGRVRSGDRLDRLGITHGVFPMSGTPEDAAILLAHAGGAALIVLVGSHSSLVEMVDKGRSAMASSFLTRAAVGSTVVDAKAVAELYRHRISRLLVLLLVVLAVGMVAAAIATTPVGQDWWHQLKDSVHDLYISARDQLQ